MAAIGHGTRTEMSPDEAWPSPARRPATPRPRIRRRAIRARRTRPRAPADNARDWTEGEVLFIDADEIALAASRSRARRGRRALSAAGLRLAAT
jgi:hypothetical protein